MGLLFVLAFSGTVPPQTHLPALALYLASRAGFVTGVVIAVLMLLPPANAYFARRAAQTLETPACSEPRPAGRPELSRQRSGSWFSPGLSPRFRQC